MKKFQKIFLMGIAIGSLFASSIASAGWVVGEVTGMKKYVTSNGTVIGRYFGIPPRAQEESYTCGATTIEMQFIGETGKDGRFTDISRTAIYNFGKSFSSDAEKDIDGFNTNELKRTIAEITSLLNNSHYNFNLKVEMKEDGDDTVSDSVSQILDYMNISKGASIIYGNVLDGVVGMHYYLVKGVFSCSSCVNGEGLHGLLINDSVYNSDLYREAEHGNLEAIAIDPYKFVWEHKNNTEREGTGKINKKLHRYWSKTGHYLEVFREHKHLSNNAIF